MLNEKGKRELAYVVTIKAIEPIVGSDNCEAAIIGGWKVMVRKGTFKPNDLAVYFEIDSQVPAIQTFAFLEPKHYKVRTQKYTFGGKNPGFYSQGLLMTPSDFGWYSCFNTDGVPCLQNPDKNKLYPEGYFLTEELGVTYYDPLDRARKLDSEGDKYQKMARRMGKKFSKQPYRWLMKRTWGKKLLYVFFGHTVKKNSKAWPDGRFAGVSRTDQERCLFAKTKVRTNEGDIEISKIVNAKLPVKVLSLNPDGTLSYKKILDYQKFENKDDVLTITYPYAIDVARTNSIVCTPDHRLLTQRGYVPAKDLTPKDSLLIVEECYGEDSFGAIYGMLLGDSHIYEDKRYNGKLRVVATNGEAQLPYLEYKRNCFNGEGSICDAGKGTYGKDKTVFHWNLPVDGFISQAIRKDFFKNGKKEITKEVIEKINEVGLAFWYMDDGNLSYREDANHRPSIRLSTQGFSKEENELLCDMLNNKFNISCHIVEERRENKPIYYHLYIDVNGTHEFLKIISPYMHKSMAYKTLPEFEYLLETKFLKYEKRERAVHVPILNIEIGQKKFKGLSIKPSFVYDLEVEDNHNFVTANIISHNCENRPWVLEDKTPYIVTQKCDGSSGTFILEKKPFGKYEFYVCSRNVRMLSQKQECYYGEHNYYWEVALNYNIENKMKKWLKENNADWVCWQGEVCAPQIQKNPQGLTKTHLFCFHWTDSINGRLNIVEAAKKWKEMGMEVVPIVDENYILPDDMEEFKLSAEGKYDASVCEGKTDCDREGFVYYKSTDPTFSFKNVSRSYLLKH